MLTLKIEFTPSEYRKLEQLAFKRQTSITNILREFARAIHDGPDWKHPSKAKSVDDKKDLEGKKEVKQG